MGIRIITDSTSDISAVQAKELGVTIIPLKVIFGDKEYKEGIEITMEGFYDKLVKAEKLPTTSQPSPDDFLTSFLEAKKANDSVIVILISGKLSGTLQSATIAKDLAEYEDIHIVDSQTTITGLRFLVEHAVKLSREGKSATEIVPILEELKDRIVLLAMVDTLEYLHKGGRLSKSSAILGSLLKFKPIITVKDGVIGVVGKERGTNKGIAKMLEIIEERGLIDDNYPLYFGYTAEDSKTKQLMESVKERFGIANSTIHPVGCVVGTHAGPGACVITYISKA
ncbi:MAG: DegV family protein [Herbinix sp.]|jgi:DegV family protein with EDD domain|nr:DegV family protein [Herbinix sp.]